MALLPILTFPDTRLRTIASDVLYFDDDLEQLICNMFDTMYDALGVGLAATQVNFHKRVITLDISHERNQPQIFINPTYEIIDETLFTGREGCLSIPGYQQEILRSQHISVKCLNGQGQPLIFEAQGLLAVCIQHEIDHLDGKLYIDYLAPQQRGLIESEIISTIKIDNL